MNELTKEQYALLELMKDKKWTTVNRITLSIHGRLNQNKRDRDRVRSGILDLVRRGRTQAKRVVEIDWGNNYPKGERNAYRLTPEPEQTTLKL